MRRGPGESPCFPPLWEVRLTDLLNEKKRMLFRDPHAGGVSAPTTILGSPAGPNVT
jgi:hypothetical protein